LRAFPRLPARGAPLGLYVHVPESVGLLRDFFILRHGHPVLDALEAEAEALSLPRALPFATLYVGGGGAGALAALEADDIARLLAWLRRRFSLAVGQASAEVDACRLDRGKARALAAGGVDRVCARLPVDDGTPLARVRRQVFRDGLAACRAAGVRTICIDVPAESAARDAAFARALRPDDVVVCGGAPARRPSRAGNLQLAHAAALNASVLGLGWGAVSHARERLVYGPATGCFAFVDGLLKGRPPAYAGAPLDADGEMRAHVVRALEDVGEVDGGVFARAFGRPLEEVFPGELAALSGRGLLSRSGGLLRVVEPEIGRAHV
jgi:coproporphyrinogen III oxidase-like Fe-S oxidoreductase